MPLESSPRDPVVRLPTGSTVVRDTDWLRLPGARTAQICRTVVERGAGEGARIVIVVAAEPPGPFSPDARRVVLAGEPPGTIAVVVQEATDGQVAVEAAWEDLACAPDIAAAVAVMRASWAWDESPVIRVAINGGEPKAIAPRYDGGRWVAAAAANRAR